MISDTNKDNENTTAVRFVHIDLLGKETVLKRKTIVVQVPVDCGDKELKECSGISIEECASRYSVDSSWRTDESQHFEVLNDVEVGEIEEKSLAEAPHVDLTFIRHKYGSLILKES